MRLLHDQKWNVRCHLIVRYEAKIAGLYDSSQGFTYLQVVPLTLVFVGFCSFHSGHRGGQLLGLYRLPWSQRLSDQLSRRAVVERHLHNLCQYLQTRRDHLVLTLTIGFTVAYSSFPCAFLHLAINLILICTIPFLTSNIIR
jgi:hypothetical protein